MMKSTILSLFTAFVPSLLALPSAPTGWVDHETLMKSANALTKVHSSRSIWDIVDTWDLNNITLAAVRVPPVSWPMPLLNKNWTGVELDLEATVDLGIELIEQAAKNDARVIHFPEVWFPGYPKGIITTENPDPWFGAHVKDYVENSLVVGSDNWNKLAQAAVDNEIYLGFGFSEKADDHLFIAQALIAPDGEVLIHRHKLRPSRQERDLWTDGQLDEFHVVPTPIGRIGMLSCYEHITPEAMFSTQAQAEDIHLGSWPYTPDFGNPELGYESAEVMTTFALYYASISNAAVIQASVGLASIYPTGQTAEVSRIGANESFSKHPMVYRAFNASATANVTYNQESEVSWGTLKGLNKAFPSYIPKEEGDFTRYHEQNLQELLAESDY